MGEEHTPDLRWSVEQRLEFIEFRLFWEDSINRSDLVDHFNISVPQASADLGLYQKIAAGNVKYDSNRKTYVPTRGFKPLYLAPSTRDYLSQLRLIADGVSSPKETWCGWLPPFDVVPLVRRRASITKLRKVLQAIRSRRALYIHYQSMGRPEPLWRWITPHALGFDGFRWHVRARCHRNDDFRDFVLARMLTVDKFREDRINPEQDREWQETLVLKIGPNPKLSPGARQAIELDYGMKNGVLELACRVCLSFYMESHLGLDLDTFGKFKVPAKRQQIVLLNRAEVEDARAAAKAATGNAM